MTKGFLSTISLFAISAVAVPMALDAPAFGNATKTGQVPTSSPEYEVGRCGFIKTVYVTETPAPSPAVVTVEIQVVTPTTSSQQSTPTVEAAAPVAPAPEAPKAPEAPAPEAPKAPEAPEAPKAPETQEAPKAPEAPAPEAKAPESDATPAAPPAPAEKAPETNTPVTPPSDGGNADPLSGAANVVHKGEATYYSPDGAAGACGNYNTDSDKVVALPYQLYDALKGSKQSRCNDKIRITYNGKTVDATVADRCPGCLASEGHLDLSTSLFEELADTALGVIKPIYWEFL